MVLVSITVAVLVVLAVFLTVLQCWRCRGTFSRFRSSPGGGNSDETNTESDSDYSSYTEEDGDTLEQSTVFSDRINQVNIKIFECVNTNYSHFKLDYPSTINPRPRHSSYLTEDLTSKPLGPGQMSHKPRGQAEIHPSPRVIDYGFKNYL